MAFGRSQFIDNGSKEKLEQNFNLIVSKSTTHVEL